MADRQPSPVVAGALAIVVPGRPPNWGNLRLGWADRHRLVANRKALVRISARAALSRARLAPAATACRVEATVFIAGRQFDPDNLWASLKADIDGLVAAGLLVDDSPTWCRLEVEQVSAPRRGQRVEYHVTRLTASPAGVGQGQPSPGHGLVLQDPGSGSGHRTGERNAPAGAEGCCPACGEPLPPRIPGPGGRPRVYCSRSCRSRAHLRQGRGLPVDLPKQPSSGRRRLGAPRL